MVSDNYLGRRVASRRNVTRLLVVVTLFFSASSIQWSGAVGMWSKAAAVDNAAAQRRAVHDRRRCAAGASSTCPWPAGREAPGPRRPRSLSAAISHFGRHDNGPAQSAQDHFFRPLGAPGFDPALQRPQLRVAGIGFREHSRQSIHQHFRRGSRLGNEPAVDERPRIGKRINFRPPPVLSSGLLAMRGSGLSIFPRRGQALDEGVDVWRPNRCGIAWCAGAANSVNFC